MTGIPCENSHKHGESVCKIGFNGKYLCQECTNAIGPFDQFGPLDKPSKERDASTKIASEQPKPEAKPAIVLPKDKKCSICGKTVPLEQFENDRRRPDGHGPRCKPCIKVKRGTTN